MIEYIGDSFMEAKKIIKKSQYRIDVLKKIEKLEE